MIKEITLLTPISEISEETKGYSIIKFVYREPSANLFVNIIPITQNMTVPITNPIFISKEVKSFVVLTVDLM